MVKLKKPSICIVCWVHFFFLYFNASIVATYNFTTPTYTAIVMGMKTTKSTWFSSQYDNKGMFSSKTRSWNKKKQKQKHDTCKTKIQQDFVAKEKQNKVITRKHTQN